MPTSTTVLSTNPAVAVPLLTINGWILMQRKVTGGSVSFTQDWIEYRDGFGSPSGNDNYWLGLEKIYRLQQFGNVRLRVEVKLAVTVFSSQLACMAFTTNNRQKVTLMWDLKWNSSNLVHYKRVGTGASISPKTLEQVPAPPFFPLPSVFHHTPRLSLEVGRLNPARGSLDRCKVP